MAMLPPKVPHKYPTSTPQVVDEPLRADARTKLILDQLMPAVQAVLKPYEGRPLENMPIQQLVSGPLLKIVQQVFHNDLNATEFRRWVKFEAYRGHIDIKLNTELIYTFRAATPSWVYALYWAFKPNFAPTFKTTNNDH